MKAIPLKIQDVHRAHRCGIVVTSYADLLKKGRQKLNLEDENSTENLRICLETDGTDVSDDAFLRQLAPNTVLVFLKSDEHWLGYLSYLMTAFEAVKKISPLYQARERIEETLHLESDPTKLSAISAFVTALDSNRALDSREDDPEWFVDLPKPAKSKEQVMTKSAKSRVTSYFYAARRSIQAAVTAEIYGNIFGVIFEDFAKQLRKYDYYGGYFARAASEEVRLCDEEGWFNCQGPFDAENCGSFHLINPYDNKESRIVFSTWNLDHQIEKSRAVIPGLLAAAQNVPKSSVLNWDYFYQLLFTRTNLRLVHIVCHKKCEHSSKQLVEREFFVKVQRGRKNGSSSATKKLQGNLGREKTRSARNSAA